MPYNFAADSFHIKKLCSRYSSSEVRFYIKPTTLQQGPVDPKFQVEGVAPANHSSSQKTEWSFVWYKNLTDLFFVLSQSTPLTDRRTAFSSLCVCIPWSAATKGRNKKTPQSSKIVEKSCTGYTRTRGRRGYGSGYTRGTRRPAHL